MVESLGKAYKPWVLLSVTVLVGSLALLTGTATASFVVFQGAGTPVWLFILGALGALGVALGFGGFFLLMLIAGWHSFREGRRVELIPPHERTKP